MPVSAIFKNLYTKTRTLFREEFSYMYNNVDANLEGDDAYYNSVEHLEEAWSALLHGIYVTEKKSRCRFSCEHKAFSSFARIFKLYNFQFINKDYGGYNIYTALNKMDKVKQQTLTNYIGNLLLVVKKTQSEKKRINIIIANAMSNDEEFTPDSINLLKNELIDIFNQNKHDFELLFSKLAEFRKTYDRKITMYSKVLVDIINQDLLGYMENDNVIPDNIIEQFDELLNTDSNTDMQSFIPMFEKMFTLIAILPKPPTSGKLGFITDIVTAALKYIKNKDLKKLLKPKNVYNVEALVEMLSYPIISGELREDLEQIKCMFDSQQPQTSPKEFIANIMRQNEPIGIIKGLLVHKNPLRIESLDESKWSQSFCTRINKILSLEMQITDVDPKDLFEGSYLDTLLNLILNKSIDVINKRYNLNYSVPYLFDIITVIINDD